jgi:hypothetical protein
VKVVAKIVCLSTLLLWGFALSAGPAQAQLGGVSLSAQGFGVQMTYNEPQAPVPSPTLQTELAYSEAEFTAGPSSHALSSILWPGPTFADGGPSFCPQYNVPFDCPAYPVRAEAFTPGAPHRSKNDQYGPNTTMQAKAGTSTADASTTMESSDQAKPAVVTGDFSSSSSTTLAGDQAISVGTAHVSDVTIAGVVHVDSILSTAKAVTNGKNGVVSGKTEVSGVTVNGQAVTVDRKGVHVGGHSVPVFDPIDSGQVQQALQQAGMTMKVASPVDNLKGAQAGRSLGGLVVEFQAGALNAIIGKLPSQISSHLQKYINFGQTITLSIGGVLVDSNTLAGYGSYHPPTSPPSSGPPPGSGGSFGGTGGSSGGSLSGGSSFGGGGAGGGGISFPSTPKSSGGGGTVATTPISAPLSLPPVKGVPAALAVFALVAAAAASMGLRTLAERAMGAGAGAGERCPLEEMKR